jgi:hypothetical protein
MTKRVVEKGNPLYILAGSFTIFTPAFKAPTASVERKVSIKRTMCRKGTFLI